MIFIDNNTTMGSKAFTVLLADLLRPKLTEIVTADELDDFELDLTQMMIHFGGWSANTFNQVIVFLEEVKDLGEEKQILLKMMKSDPRYKQP